MDEKKVDESWKESVEKEKEKKQQAGDGQNQKTPSLEANFPIFISGLAMQAMMAMGLMADPRSGSTTKDLNQAKYLIDIIAMLKEKTTGNITDDESKLVDELLHDLRMQYVSTCADKKE